MTAGRPLSPRDVRRQGDPGLTSPRLSRMEKPQLCHPCSGSGHWPCGITWHLPFRRGGGPAAATQRPLGLLYHPPPRPHPGGQLVRPGQGPLGRVHGDPGHGWTVTLRPVLSLGLGFQPSSPGPMSVQGECGAASGPCGSSFFLEAACAFRSRDAAVTPAQTRRLTDGTAAAGGPAGPPASASCCPTGGHWWGFSADWATLAGGVVGRCVTGSTAPLTALLRLSQDLRVVVAQGLALDGACTAAWPGPGPWRKRRELPDAWPGWSIFPN